MARRKETPSQTAGPYVHIGCTPSVAGLAGHTDLGNAMVTDPAVEKRITLSLTILDGEDVPVADAMIEIWQTGPEGAFGATDGFCNWGRQPTDATGEAVFETLKPGKIAGQAPHIFVWIVARGINLGLQTRVYFPDEPNDSDAVFRLAGQRAETLVAQAVSGGYHHTISLQGDAETVFFDV